MQRLHAEVGVTQLSKDGEELCGDNVVIARTPQATIIVLSDGLGSGVKANILATLTTKIASSMLKRGIPLEDVVNTIAETLPVCRQRKIAYSTLQIIKVKDNGLATIVEFDCPPTFLIRDGQVSKVPTQVNVIGGKKIKVGRLTLLENDIITAVSDGVIHAGIGGLLKLGWGWNGVADELKALCKTGRKASDITNQLIKCSEGYYLGHPGDDSTAVAVRVHKARFLTLFTGPPADSGSDEEIIRRFLNQPGRKVVAGGTTANIVSKVTGKPLTVDLALCDQQVPPISYMDDIDLVTEGILTLNVVLERLNDVKKLYETDKCDGATLLARLLLEADMIDIMAGKAVNPAHQNPNYPFKINIKSQVLANLKALLEAKGKQVKLEWF
ncbi:SpoIIE family protein phosphatase|uniref:Stage II sporulation protein E (SpoIIE) n=1 Tax=Dendrosporobacter quercicolus TaxID=146817 RepID=A0A1G9KLV5_9FIRM|nr:SpoIIE family protein phosphatase [Dendrosporobacter quercicolus]NSL46448.1 SpoIIE family protein phosphatase [Dendrosporobacter quercicolus DSM 1736]SDL50770.1 Stage II sporulation protein E (SpoIIE) [Dendrosporobacter quercicolus]